MVAEKGEPGTSFEVNFESGEGTKEAPYKPSPTVHIRDVLRDAAYLSSSRSEDIFFDSNGHSFVVNRELDLRYADPDEPHHEGDFLDSYRKVAKELDEEEHLSEKLRQLTSEESAKVVKEIEKLKRWDVTERLAQVRGVLSKLASGSKR